MKKPVALAALAALCAVPVLAGSDESSSKALFEEKCSVCHSTDRPLSTAKDASGWEITCMRMHSKIPARISDAEAAKVIRYLTKVRGK